MIRKNREKNWQKKVLEDFKKKSPSKVKIENKSIFKKYIQNHLNLFNENLKFPVELFHNKKVLDLGCGTGEVDIVLNYFGAKCYGIDFNQLSIDRAKSLKKKYNIKNVSFKNLSIENYKVKKNFFDISISFGVIAHVYNREKLFEKLVKSTKKNGYIILGYVEDAGLIQRLLHRAIVRKLSNNNEKNIFSLAKKLFAEHIQRSIKYGLRTEDGIINDYLVNQAYVGLSMKEIIKWQKKFNLKFYSKSPDASLPLRVDPGFQTSKLINKINNEIFAISSLRSIFAQKTDSVVFSDMIKNDKNLIQDDINKFVNIIYKQLQKKNNTVSKKELKQISNYQKRISKKITKISNLIKDYSIHNFEKLSKEIVNILNEISRKNFSFNSLNKKTKFLFKGYNGLGTSYIIFKKQ